jgi:hypothetical protein
MQAWNAQKSLQIGLCLIALATLIGCGSSKTSEGIGSSSSSSTVAATTNNSDAMALCSQDVAGNSDLKVEVMQYVDAYGKSRPDYVRLKFLKTPAGWSTANWDMNIKRWAVSPDNQSSIDSTALQYQFETRTASGFQLLTDYSYQVFNYDEVKQMAAYENVDPSSFFNQTTLLVNLKGDAGSFQALRVEFSQGGASGSVETYVDVLIPTFQADPAKYDADSRHPYTLQVLHPLKDKLGQAWTQSQYYDFTRGFCF